ncbi:hypothetical protein [Paraburkholderia sp. GAS32]|uniref:hypothetical protein n=1 Tax=Paraburkholderia sp. GAS32 TaxID=3035129 RepID=UPI003D1FEE2C
MKTKLVTALLTALCASLTAPAFASGYGPAPSYRPSVGAPALQRGQSAETIAAERQDSAATQQNYGGVTVQSSQSGGPAVTTLRGDLFAHH